MKKYICILAALFTLSGGMTSCESMKRVGGFLGLENKVRVPAQVIACQSPSVTRYSGSGVVGGGSARTRLSGYTTVVLQKITVRRLDNNTVMSGTIPLESTNDRVWRGNSGYALIGQVSGEIRGFEVTAD